LQPSPVVQKISSRRRARLFHHRGGDFLRHIFLKLLQLFK
jgi:hypothetical protein